jgi:GH24 family phage-related lysozyme (muramidase)
VGGGGGGVTVLRGGRAPTVEGGGGAGGGVTVLRGGSGGGGPAPAAHPATGSNKGGGGAAGAPGPISVGKGVGDFIRKQEGLVLHPYSDVGHPAIGYGHDFTPQEMAQGFVTTDQGNVSTKGRITKEQAEAIFRVDYSKREQQVARMAPGFSGLNKNEKEAIMSYYYNTGRLPRALKENLASGNKAGIAQSLRGGIATVHGQRFEPLVKRRAQEAQLFETPAVERAVGGEALTSGGGSGHTVNEGDRHVTMNATHNVTVNGGGPEATRDYERIHRRHNENLMRGFGTTMA